MKAFFSILLLSISLKAMEQAKVQPLSKETAYLVHATRIFPKDGHIIAGSMVHISFHEEGAKSTLEELYEQASRQSTSWKNTVHWSLNSLVYPRSTTVHPQTGQVMGLEDKRYAYIIIEPMKAFKEKELHGYWQDLYHLGGHRLSADAVILVPAKSIYKDFVGAFPGTCREYEEELEARQEVESLLARNGAPSLYPCMDGLHWMRELAYHHNGLSQAVMVNDLVYTCADVSELLGVDNTMLDQTPLGKLQKVFATDLSILRSAQLLELLRHRMIPLEDFFNNRCYSCDNKAKKKNNPCKKFLICKKCTIASYCSSACRKSHQATHAKCCSLQKGFYTKLGLIHAQYLKRLKENVGDELSKDITNCLELMRVTYAAEREQEILDTYEEYLMNLLGLLYSKEPLYANIRAFFKVDTLQGFILFAQEMRYILSSDEALLGKDTLSIRREPSAPS